MQSDNWTRHEYLGEARDYIYFKTGTWWVYKKIPGGQLDTIEVKTSWIDTFEISGNGNKLIYDECYWVATSKHDNFSYKFYNPLPSPDINIIKATTKFRSPYFISKSRPGYFSGITNVVVVPFSNEVLNNGHGHVTKMLDDIKTINVQGNTYNDVKHINISNDATFSWGLQGDEGGIVEYYWAPKVGIIKKEHMTKNISWELVESHVVP